MTCYRPVTAFRPVDGGPILFSEKANTREIQIPCGRCIGCRIRRRDGWAIRCLLESKCHAENAFITLTYDEAHVPALGALDYRDFQLFAKRARDKIGPFRFFVAGEYGEQYGRPHFHMLMFGNNFADRVKSNSMYSRSDLYSSATLTNLWGKGMCSIGEVSFASARYCAAYICSKRDPEDPVYSRVDQSTGEVIQVPREFARMSLRPGIGFPWLEKYWRDIYATGNFGIPVNGALKSVPSYFHRVLDRVFGVSADVADWFDYERCIKALEVMKPEDQTRERLEVREEVAQARERFNNERRRSN